MQGYRSGRSNDAVGPEPMGTLKSFDCIGGFLSKPPVDVQTLPVPLE